MKKATILALSLLLGTVVVAQRGPRDGDERRGGDRGDRMEMIMERLDLSEDQMAQIEDLKLDHFKSMQGVRNDLRIKQAELQAQVSADEPDATAVNNTVSAINDLRGQQFAAQVSHRLEVRNLLDEEQKVKFDAIHEHKATRGAGRRGHRGF